MQLLPEPERGRRRIDSPAAAAALFAPLALAPLEIAAFAYLAEDCRLLALRHSAGCRHDCIDLPLRAVVADSAVTHAAAVVMAHNHPGGDATPSPADHEATRQLARALAALGVRLLDHLVVTREEVVSFRALRLL